MQISKRVLLACATATVLLPLVLSAADSEAQIKARQALEQKMKELQGQTAVPAPPPAKPVTQPPTQPPAAPQAVKPPPAAAAAPVAATAPGLAAPANDAQTKALQDALNKRMNELQSVPATTSAAPTPTPAPPVIISAPPTAAPAATAAAATAATQAAQPSAGAEGPIYQEIPLTATSTTDASALEQALQRSTMEDRQSAISSAVKEAQANQQLAASQTPPPAQVKVKPSRPASRMQAELPPLPTPPAAVSAGKEQQLHALLQQYMSDQITPEQYHERRAQILAGQ